MQGMGGEETWPYKQVSSAFLFVTGLCTAPALIIQDNLLVKLLQLLLYLSLNRLAGRKLLLGGSLIFFVTSIFFNLLSPVGRVLFSLGSFPITRGALRVGFSKALTIIALLYLSRFCVSDRLRLPGAFGRYVSKTLLYLRRLVEEKKSFTRRDLIGSLDRIFEKLLYSEPLSKEPDRLERNTLAGVLAAISLPILNWGLVFLEQGWFKLGFKPIL